MYSYYFDERAQIYITLVLPLNSMNKQLQQNVYIIHKFHSFVIQRHEIKVRFILIITRR